MIPRIPFGRTNHVSSRIIFGSYALSNASQEEADQVLKLLLKYEINHIDTAHLYGLAEERIGPWMEKHRKDFFLATKTRNRGYEKVGLCRWEARVACDAPSLLCWSPARSLAQESLQLLIP